MRATLFFESLREKVIAELSAYAKELSNEIDIPGVAYIDVGTSDSTDVSASAYWNKKDNCYQIILNHGLCVWAFDIAVSSCVHLDQDFAADFSHRLDIDDYTRNSLVSDLNQKTILAEQRLSVHQQGFCRYLFGTICLVVFAHELAHIISGHIDYLKSRCNDHFALIDELHIVKRSGKSVDLPVGLMEYEADLFGSRWLVELAIGKRRCPDLWNGYTAQQNIVLGLWVFVLFTIAIEEASVISGLKTGQYPAPMLRFTIAVSAMKRAWTEETSHDRFQQDILNPVCDLLESFEPIFPAIDYARNFTDERWASTIKQEAEKLATDHKSIIDKMNRYRLKYI